MAYEIIKPCSENWDKMKPVEGGRFCDKCSKKVHDLTSGATLPDTGENFCGRIYTEKINRISFFTMLLRQKPLQFFILMITLLFSRNLKAQTEKNDSIKTTGNPKQIPADTNGKKITITGTKKKKKNKETVPFANIVVYDKHNNQLGATNSDIDGKYTIELTNVKVKYISLKAVYVGYQSVIIKDIPLTTQKKEINIQFSGSEAYLGFTGMIIACPPFIDPFGSEKIITREDFLHNPKG